MTTISDNTRGPGLRFLLLFAAVTIRRVIWQGLLPSFRTPQTKKNEVKDERDDQHASTSGHDDDDVVV